MLFVVHHCLLASFAVFNFSQIKLEAQLRCFLASSSHNSVAAAALATSSILNATTRNTPTIATAPMILWRHCGGGKDHLANATLRTPL